MNPVELIEQYYTPGTGLYRRLMDHSRQVAEKALAVAENLKHMGPDAAFIEEAAMLHDIAIFMTDTPKLSCYGQHPYVCHGILGRILLEKQGLHRHALVCERHVGVGLTEEDIQGQGLPLPVRDMRPVTLEERIIAYADKFFSKDRNGEKPVEEIGRGLSKYGKEKAEIFYGWHQEFSSAAG